MMGEPERGSAAWWEDRYRGGDISWDTGVVPPEVVSLVASGLLTHGALRSRLPSPRISAGPMSAICASWACRRRSRWTSAVFTPFPLTGSELMWIHWPRASCRAPTICSMLLNRSPT
jgi:hypothetical protein